METGPRSDLEFGSLLVYVSGRAREADPAIESNHRVIAAIKNDRPLHQQVLGPDYLAQVFADRCAGTPLEGFLSPEDLLVPIPRAGPLAKGALWPARRIAEALHANGHAAGVLELLRRERAVPSSSRDGGKRLAHLHEQSAQVLEDRPLYPPASSLVLVDDVVSSGATALGMARLLDRIWPGLRIRLFAAARTRTWKEGEAFPSLLDPVQGRIQLRSEDRPPQRLP